MRKTSLDKTKGITFRPDRKKPFNAYLNVKNSYNTMQISIGYYSTIKEAITARNNYIDSLK